MGTQAQERIQRWQNAHDTTTFEIKPKEELPSGYTKKWEIWKTLNRPRTGVIRTKVNIGK